MCQNISESPSTPRRTSYQHLRTHLPLDLKNGQADLLRACYAYCRTFRLYCPHHSPLKVYRHGVPIGRFSHPVLDLWRAYFGFSYEVDGRSNKKHSKAGKKSHRRNAPSKGRRRRNTPSKGQRKRRRQDAAAKSYMIAQMPHGIVVRGWDWLLCYPFAATQSESVLPDLERFGERVPRRHQPLEAASSLRAGAFARTNWNLELSDLDCLYNPFFTVCFSVL